jgi:hypothetical protein
MLAALLMLSFSLLVAQLPPMPPGAANARVTGRVVDAGTSVPVPGAFVTLVPVAQPFPPWAMSTPQALTDDNGEFAVERIWAGRYHIRIQKTGFAPLSDVPDAPMLDIQAGQSVTGLAFAMKKESVIAGRIVDAGGEPVSEAMVAALRPTPSGDGRSSDVRTMQMSQTNDGGEFRLAGLAEGRYVVIAAPRPRPPFATSQPGGGTVLAPTYYPGTPDREAAHIIDIGAGQTIEGIQFAVVALPAHEISGIVVDAAGVPQAGVMLTLMGSPGAVGPPGPPATARTDQTGAFTIGGVVAGTYRVTAMVPIAVGVRDDAGANAGLRFGGRELGAASGIDVAAPVGGFQIQGLPSTEVTVDVTDVTGVWVVVPARRP